MKIAYVILHYLAVKDTIECVESIINNVDCSNHERMIIVIDNGSPNDSYQRLTSVFRGNNSVIILKSEKNLGFAKGNNLGFSYAKHQYNADFIVMLNNDTIITQPDFSNVLVNKYIEREYGVLGPDIITADGYHQNPGTKQSWELKELRIDRLKKRIRILCAYLHIDRYISKTIKYIKEVYRKETLKGDVDNTILHGACLIFSPLYIKRFEGLHDKTFLYMEEDILKLYADHYGFLMLYSSELQIFHKEDAATNSIEISDTRKRIMKYRYLIKSSLVYSQLKKEWQREDKHKE